MDRKCLFTPLLFYGIFLQLLQLTTQNVRHKRNISPELPRIMTQNGHLVFKSGVNHNISFQAVSGGFINIGKEDLNMIIKTVKDNKLTIEQLQTISTTAAPSNLASRLAEVERRLDNLQPTGQLLSQLSDLTSRINSIENLYQALNTRLNQVEQTLGNSGQIQSSITQLTNRVSSLSRTVENLTAQDFDGQNERVSRNLRGRNGTRRITRRIRILQRRVNQLRNLLTVDECDSNPCRNGATCEDKYNGFICRCPPAWQGLTCEQDVNECGIYAGTDLGCQNGATCINSQGGFTCHCTADWHGVLCTERHEDCTGASNEQMCGHGTCINVQRTQPNMPKYRCICDDGWTNSNSDPACTVDVNECTERPNACSQDPPVICINLPGSFQCGSCPSGYVGNGFSCADVNECETNNGGCSLAPRVDCINTRGSRRCGPCPSSFVGDGMTCIWVGVCGQNNGGCHPLATCTESPGYQARTCTCPQGYIGNGIVCSQQGPVTGACSPNPCRNGALCQNSGSSFRCVCNPGYGGVTCQTNINECSSRPCQNGGTCVDQINGYTCQCAAAFSGTNCQEQQQSCGGNLDGNSGSITYPATPGTTYPHGVDCAWKIRASQYNKIIMLNFSRFAVEQHPACNFDYLQIHDGSTAAHHRIGKYCGNHPPNGGTVNTTQRSAYLWFHSDQSFSHDGFAVTWRAVQPVCGGELTGSQHGIISSPGYPGDYPNDRDCVWRVTVSPGNNIMFAFAALSLEIHPNCSHDYLQIRDGHSDTSRLLGTYCNRTLPSPLTTTGPHGYILFHTDHSIASHGFQITYAAVSAGPQCGGTLTNAEGTFASPNYPSPYNHDASCVWVISVHTGDQITLTFNAMNLESHANCGYDYVLVRDGGDEDSDLIGQYCGSDIPAALTSSGSSLYVEFRSDESNAGSGFQATYSTGCGGSFTGEEGIIQSPYYPNPYPENKECIYMISVPQGSRVTLTFNSFDIEGGAGCDYDYVEIRDGYGSDSELLGRFCESDLPDPVTSTGSMLWVKFKSDGSVQNHGFQASYSAAESAACGGTLTDSTGSFTSPGHPNVHPHGVNCTWFIRVDPGLVIRLTFNAFTLEGGVACRFDYVEVFDNSTATPDSSLGRKCGSVVPPVVTSTNNYMTVRFVSDSSIAHEGFHISYVALNASTLCGDTLTDSTGIITSPNYPNNYPHNRECIWTIIARDGNQILLNITSFELENHRSCSYDYLEIRNGGFQSSPLIGSQPYCGTTVPPTIVSDSNRIFLKFVTDGSASAKGFRIYYDSTASGCGADLTSPTGGFVSPNYPHPYTHNAECFWTITVSRGSAVTLVFVDFFLEDNHRCEYDYVEVRENGPRGKKLALYCGSQTPDPVTSSTNKLWIKYRTDSSVNGRGFHATYFTNCNLRLTSWSGVIESPNFPDPYYNNRNCTWIIQTTMGNTINASFSHFDVESHSTCQYDFLQIRDGDTMAANEIGTYCGERIPPAIASSGETLWINFMSDYSLAGNGFRLEYITNGCGGYLTSPTGSFTSPGYPQPYPHRRECVWHISVPTGSAIQLTLQNFDLESHASCQYDVLEIYEGRDNTGPLLATICHKQKQPQIMTSTGNNMYIRFASDNSVSGNGFQASYQAVLGGCGGNFSTPSGTLMSKNYPENYPHNTECEWQLTVKEGRSVVLTFLDFDVEGSTGRCPFDYVAGYDGTDANSTELFKHCGTAVPSPSVIQSTGNQMFIRMRTDSSVSAKGFKATYTTGCGGELSAEADGELISPNYPLSYGPMNNCTWVIRGEHSNDRVTLTFTHMDLELNRICNHDYVVVYDGDDANGTEIGTYCGNTIPAPITSQGSAMTVQFISDQSIQMSGFRAVYTKSISSCGGNFTAEQGSFTSPGYPNEYPMNTECVWTVYTSPGNQIMIAFSFFRLEDHLPDCNMDYLELREGNVHGRLIGRYCGYDVPSNITSVNGLWMKFRSDESLTEQGFIAQYSSVYGGILTGNTGQVASPRYPNNYPNNANYVWTISTDIGTMIKITFLTLDMERSGLNTICIYDFVQFQDGDQADSPVLGTYCGSSLPDPFYTTTNQLRVRFQTDFSSHGQGFLFTWEATTDQPTTTTVEPSTTPVPGCGGIINPTLSSPQTVTSPGYPNGYQSALNCVWRVVVPDGNRVWANITDINLESYGQCNYDYVEFGNRYQKRGTSLGRFCGRDGNPQPIISEMSELRITFVTDYSINKTGFSILVKQVCGGQLHGGSGVVASDNYPNPYLPNSNCSWYISVLPGRTIRVQFNGTFNIAGSGSNCQGDYIQLLNGRYSSSPPLGNNPQGKYCGSTPPQTMETGSHVLKVRFISNGNNNAAGFSLTFNEVQVTCGGHLTLSNSIHSRVFMSPNYPSNYTHNLECIWIITAPANERVQVDFDDNFSIESHSTCLFDYIELRDGGTTNSRSLGKFCGTTVPGTVKSTGNVLFARFRTDSSSIGIGFKAYIRLATCGGTIRGQSGYIQSPNFPSPYDSNSDCEWYIHGPTGHYLTFNFLNFNLQYGSNCTVVDYIEIREYNATGPLLKRACGSSMHTSVDTSDSFAYIRFKSNSAINRPGFKLVFTSSVEACGGDMVTPVGSFTSPNYPGQYPHSRTCEWKIKVQRGRKVSLKFDNFNLEPHRNCQFDYIEVYNGILDDSPRIVHLCGDTNPGTVESYGNTMKVIFKTDGSVSNGGFRASYTSSENAVCGGILTQGGGNITSVGYSNGNYSNSEECIWLIQNPSLSDSTIRIDFVVFMLESHGECYYDYLEIREGTDENGELLGRFCGNQTTPGPVFSPLANLWIRFKSDFSLVDRGFYLKYDFTDCGGVLTSSSGVISSPNFPNYYNHSDACAWLIQQPEGFRVNAQFTNFSLEYNHDCGYDYVQILNGGLPSSPSAGHFCGNNTIANFVSQSNAIRVIFKSDFTIASHGFQMTYYQSAGGCGGLLNSNSGNISSPNYPQSYPHLTECQWDINVERGYHIILTFIPPFDLEAESNCDYDFVEVDDALPNNTLVPRGRWCHNRTPPQQITSSNRIVVRFQSDRNTNGNGFAANWTAGCGAVFTDEYLGFVSPGFPNGYAHNLICNYTIIGPPGRYIVLTFRGAIFDIEGPASCPHDSLTVFQGNNTRGRVLGKFCGQTPPQPVSGKGSLFLQFKTDSSVTGKGFRVSYRMSDCGGDYTDESAYIFTPTYPTNYHHNANCTWRITVQENRIVGLKFTSFELEAHETCNYDYVDVYDGDDFNAPLIGRYCGDVLPNIIRSTGNKMFINFISDSSVSKAGFSGVYWTTYGSDQGCGGILNSTSGSLTSVDSDGDGRYENSLDCVWRIIVGDNKIVRLTVSGIDVENHTACYYDYLEIRDGFNIDDISKGKYCGRQLPPVITSTSNVLLVRFNSDSSITGAGFNATYVQENALCGGTRTASDTPQTLTSPGYPNPVSQQLNCRWTIDTPDSDQHVRLTVSRLDLRTQTMCNDEYIEFRDSPLGDSGNSVHYCGSSNPDVFDSVGNTVQVNLAMLGLPNSRSTGFSLKYQIANCNRTYSGNSGQIYSPGWPGNYPINSYCEININTPPGTSVVLYFNSFQMERHQDCQYDSLLIRNGSSGSDYANLCGRAIPDPVFLQGNTAWLRFQTDNSVTHTGFSITYTAAYGGIGCGGNITGINGSLTSPGYPSNNTISQTCGWLITTPARRNIIVTLSNIYVLGTPNCNTDYLEVYNGPNEYSSKFGRYCSQETIAPLRANTNQVYVKYVSSGSGNTFMFRLEYTS